MPSDKRRRRRAVYGRTSAGNHSMNPGYELRGRSSMGFAFVDPSTMSGVDRKVSIRITLATLLTRVWGTAASVISDVSTVGSPTAVPAAGHVPQQPTIFVVIDDQIR